MIRGLDKFKIHFDAFVDKYVLIGGTACTLAMEEAGLLFRATRDLDIVLCIEALDRQFAQAFWEFISKGGYEHRQKSTGKELFYRFYSPRDQNFPQMLELFSRKPKVITLKEESHLTPIPIDDEVSSLSAILLNDDYYEFIHEGKRRIDGLPIVAPEYLIPMKARAWIDLSEKTASGGQVDEKTIRKHKNDIIRLCQLLSMENSFFLPVSIKQDMKKFLDQMQRSKPVDLKSFGMKNTKFEEVVMNLRKIYAIN